MPNETVAIKRYPNRRFYAPHTSAYDSLPEIEKMIRDGYNVEIRDSQTDEDITRTVLTQIILDRQPEKMALFPTDMLHFIVRSNDLTSHFLRDYFRHSLTYLEYLQQHAAGASHLARPVHWVKAWIESLSGSAAKEADEPSGKGAAQTELAETSEDSVPAAHERNGTPDSDGANVAADDALVERLKQLEQRLAQLESRELPD
ncbi:MAG: hypothetical protein KDA61_22955 [Planctomycetales bacterium]|nr:hypothetical protein [Planctomycetales bacterium]